MVLGFVGFSRMSAEMLTNPHKKTAHLNCFLLIAKNESLHGRSFSSQQKN